MRLDRFLVERGMVESRTKAQTLIREGKVCVDDRRIQKASFEIEEAHRVEVTEALHYVSRAYLKLAPFISTMNLKALRCLDIGASTGGFSQALLEKGVQSVACVDVGSNQLHKSIASNPCVSVHEQSDIRNFKADPFDLVVCDVSFISILYIIDAIDRLSLDTIIILFKPQFEVGADIKRDRRGVLKDARAINEATKRFEAHAQTLRWHLVRKELASLKGKEGNHEYLYLFKKD